MRKPVIKVFNLNSSLNSVAVFIPGVLLLIMAVLVFVAPSLVLALAAGLFLYLGALLCFVAWKVVQFKRKFQDAAKQFGSRVEFRAFGVNPQDFREKPDIEQEVDIKKIILH